MHKSTRLLALGAATLGLSTVYPQDTDAQNKAVQVLRQKISELDRPAARLAATTPPSAEANQLQSRAADALRRAQAVLDRINAPNRGTITERIRYEPIQARHQEDAKVTLLAAAAAAEPETTEVQRKAIEALRKAEADLRAEEERAKAARAKSEAKTMTESEKKRDVLLSPSPGEREDRSRRERRS